MERVTLLEQTALRQAGAISCANRLAELLTPAEAHVPLVRIGPDMDGGYILADDLSSVDFVVSVGVGPDCSADIDLAERGIPVHQFDHTVPAPPATHKFIRFRRTGMSPGYPVPGTLPLEDLVSLIDQTGSSNGLLLLDAEGAEWGALATARVDALKRFRQISVEFHGLDLILAGQGTRTALEALERLRTAFTPIALHGNNFGIYFYFERMMFPSVCEVTFVRNDVLLELPKSSVHDFKEYELPNDPTWPDVASDQLLHKISRSPSDDMVADYLSRLPE